MTTTFYDHWRDVPASAWRWPNFSPAEIACRGTGKLLVNEPALDKRKPPVTAVCHGWAIGLKALPYGMRFRCFPD